MAHKVCVWQWSETDLSRCAIASEEEASSPLLHHLLCRGHGSRNFSAFASGIFKVRMHRGSRKIDVYTTFVLSLCISTMFIGCLNSARCSLWHQFCMGTNEVKMGHFLDLPANLRISHKKRGESHTWSLLKVQEQGNGMEIWLQQSVSVARSSSLWLSRCDFKIRERQ
jgi:hypothetical protein